MTAATTVTEVTETVTIAMAPRGLEVTARLRETTIGWGEDTRCTDCLCPLPAGATACTGADLMVCVDCAEDAGREVIPAACLPGSEPPF
jgi:hypothetical protein